MKSLLLIFTCSLASIGFSQAIQIEWLRMQGSVSFDQGAYDAHETSDGGYIYISTINSSNTGDVTGTHGQKEAWMVKTDAAGFIEWQRALGGPDLEDGYGVLETIDGGFVAVGSAGSDTNDVSFNYGGWDLWVVKVDSLGNLLWDAPIGGSAEDKGYGIYENQDGSLVVVGHTKSNNFDITLNQGLADVVVSKLSANGAIQWVKTFGGSSADYGLSINGTNDGGFIVAGQTFSSDGDITSNAGFYDSWLLKLDSIGNLQWQKTYGGSGDEKAYSVQQTSDGGYIIANETDSNDGDISFNHGGFDYWLIKTDASGNIEWEKTYGGTDYDVAQSVIETSNNRYFLIGLAYSIDGDISSPKGDLDAWVLILDNTGNILEERSIGGTAADFGVSISENANGMFIMAGASESNDGDVSGLIGNRDIMITKLRILANVGLEEVAPSSLEVIEVYDLLGRVTKTQPNTLLIYKYEDGTTKRVFKVE